MSYETLTDLVGSLKAEHAILRSNLSNSGLIRSSDVNSGKVVVDRAKWMSLSAAEKQLVEHVLAEQQRINQTPGGDVSLFVTIVLAD